MEAKEWHKQYKAYFIQYANFTEELAEDCLQAGMGGYNYNDNPEDWASDELSYWEGE